MLEKSRKLLIALSVKYKGEWNRIYESITNKELLEEKEINRLVNSIKSKYVVIGDDEYPEQLKYYTHPPFVLFYYGDISLIKTSERCLGVVGSRDCSKYGEKITQELIKGVSNQLVIVSGMARGIDSIAARECLSNSGKTVAVLGCGVNICYPSENKDLYNQIKEKGLIISEYPDDINPSPELFPKRNRIIAGLSKNLLIPEAQRNSGTSITATFAIEMGQTVFCVPERAGRNSLPNYLISFGAKLTETPEDILEEYSSSQTPLKFEI